MTSPLTRELPESSDQFRFLRRSFLDHLKGSVGLILGKTSVMRVSRPSTRLIRSRHPPLSRPSPRSIASVLFQSRHDCVHLFETGVHLFGKQVPQIVYYESIKREPKIRGIYECRCDERLQTKSKEFTRLAYTGLVLGTGTPHDRDEFVVKGPKKEKIKNKKT